MIETEKDNRKIVERAILIGVQDSSIASDEIAEHMKEMHELVETMGVPVIDDLTLTLRKPSARFYIGSGKAQEIADLAKRIEADCLIFDCDLAPSQQRNWEKLTKLCVIDRQEVIIDIFAARATTREAVIQVALARLNYSLPRLTRAWTHLSRQQGGAKGSRGEGETQLEVDKRLVQKRITVLKKELVEVVRQRNTQRKKRERNAVPHVAIVGYTNAGKSSFLNTISGSDVLVEDKLFATLDPTTRRVLLPSGREILMTDTVGFVRKLPHSLVEAFKSTLEEAVLADFILLIVDASNPYMDDHRKTTISVLGTLGAKNQEIITVFNKIDLVTDEEFLSELKASNPDAFFISTKQQSGLDELQNRIDKEISDSSEIYNLNVPPNRHDIISKLHKSCNVLSIDYQDDGIAQITAVIPQKEQTFFSIFICD